MGRSDCQDRRHGDVARHLLRSLGRRVRRLASHHPDAAVDWLVPPDGAQVVEVGAGTGKLTDRLVERGLDLDVVEPDGRMLRVITGVTRG